MALVNILRLVLITIVLRINALRFKTNFRRAHGLPLEEMNDLTLTKFPESSNIGCACVCSSYLQCTSYSLATRLCTLMTARRNVTRDQAGVDFYFLKEVDPTCVKEDGSDGGGPFDLSSAYYASYHQITRIRLYYDDDSIYLRGLEVEHGSDVAQTGILTSIMEECHLMVDVFMQRWEYSISVYEYPSLGCMTLITTHKTCGPFGDSCGAMSTLEGYHLLYIAGRGGLLIDRLSLAFDSC